MITKEKITYIKNAALLTTKAGRDFMLSYDNDNDKITVLSGKDEIGYFTFQLDSQNGIYHLIQMNVGKFKRMGLGRYAVTLFRKMKEEQLFLKLTDNQKVRSDGNYEAILFLDAMIKEGLINGIDNPEEHPRFYSERE